MMTLAILRGERAPSQEEQELEDADFWEAEGGAARIAIDSDSGRTYSWQDLPQSDTDDLDDSDDVAEDSMEQSEQEYQDEDEDEEDMEEQEVDSWDDEMDEEEDTEEQSRGFLEKSPGISYQDYREGNGGIVLSSEGDEHDDGDENGWGRGVKSNSIIDSDVEHIGGTSKASKANNALLGYHSLDVV